MNSSLQIAIPVMLPIYPIRTKQKKKISYGRTPALFKAVPFEFHTRVWDHVVVEPHAP
jgi:hypothetical protein